MAPAKKKAADAAKTVGAAKTVAATKAKAAKKVAAVKKGSSAATRGAAAPKKKKDLPLSEIASHPAPQFVSNERASFVITGKPTTMDRPRFSARKERGNVYSPSARNMNQLREKLQDVVSRARLPKDQTTVFKKKATLSFQAEFVLAKRPGRRPDLDNLLKFVLDVLNQSVWHDDGQVREVWVRMMTGASLQEERTVVTVTPSNL
jgi:Holliday junction resolvase RusA-like endonuclease